MHSLVMKILDLHLFLRNILDPPWNQYSRGGEAFQDVNTNIVTTSITTIFAVNFTSEKPLNYATCLASVWKRHPILTSNA